MFRTTFLGHQGWMFSTEAASILVDPLLCEDFGLTPRVRMRVYPPRVLEIAAFPPIDAVMYTHEHEDHFNIPSLNRISREIPIFLSALSSQAAREILREMGFTVHLLWPGRTVTIGDLEFLPIAPDHFFDRNRDEWDTMAFLVRDAGGHGNFFSAVDIAPTSRVWKKPIAIARKVGLYAMTWNLIDLSSCYDHEGATKYGPTDLVRAALSMRSEVAKSWSEPAAFLACGDGLAFEGELAWLNEQAFPADPYEVFDALAALEPAASFVACRPGQSFVMSEGRLTGREESTAFLRATQQASWPRRAGRRDAPKLQEYAPASGKTHLSPADADELSSHLPELAAHLFRSRTFLDLYSLSADELDGRRPTFALVLLQDDGECSVLEYDSQSCAFAPSASDDPPAEYVSVVECWASDLLALFRGEIGGEALLFGHARVWTSTTGPSGVPINPLAEMRSLFHPLRRPAAFLTLYRSWLAAEPAAPPRIRSRGRGSARVVG